jgi:CRP/FNR family transcriptional regulator, cyclic AMP receptor protein
MYATAQQLAQVAALQDFDLGELEKLLIKSCICNYNTGEVVINEKDNLQSQLYFLIEGRLQIVKRNNTVKVSSQMPSGEIFAAPAMLRDCISEMMIIALTNSQVLTIERESFLNAIRQTPELALRILQICDRNIQNLHHTVHDLISERALVRLVRFVEYYGSQFGTVVIQEGYQLNMRLPYYQIARSIGISCEECLLIFATIKPLMTYYSGGVIQVRNWQELGNFVNGTGDSFD